MRVNPVCRGELNPPIHNGFTGGLRDLNTLPLALLRFLCSFVVKKRKCAFGVIENWLSSELVGISNICVRNWCVLV